MKEYQKQAATEAMVSWLEHPDELGEKPKKIECVGEFELHDMRYFIFRYKKSLLGSWLLGVCGGYEGDALEHCGHVYSEMEPYDAGTAQEKAIEMVEAIRAYWMQQAAEAEEGEGGSFLSFVLLESPEWDKEQYLADLKKEWGLTLSDIPESNEGSEEESDPENRILTLIGEIDGMLATVGLMPAPVPDGEAEINAATNYMWRDAVEVTKRHQAHLLVAVLPQEKDNDTRLRAGQLLVKLCDTAVSGGNVLGVYTAGTVFDPSSYRQVAAEMREQELPVANWVYIGLRQSEEGLMSGYTYGLTVFGKKELEVVNTTADANALYTLLFNIASYVIASDVTLCDGETIGYSEEMKLSITSSEGFNLDGFTLKIGFESAS